MTTLNISLHESDERILFKIKEKEDNTTLFEMDLLNRNYIENTMDRKIPTNAIEEFFSEHNFNNSLNKLLKEDKYLKLHDCNGFQGIKFNKNNFIIRNYIWDTSTDGSFTLTYKLTDEELKQFKDELTKLNTLWMDNKKI